MPGLKDPAPVDEEMTTTAPGCPNAEEMAAFADGGLGGEKRARVVEHLADCERCYAVFSGILDFQEQEELAAAGGGAGPLPFPRRVRGLPLWAAAATVVLALGTAWWLWSLGGLPTSGELVAALETPPAVLADRLLQGPVYRGPVYRDRGERELEWSRRDFLLGVYLVDLRVALEAGDPGAAGEILRRIDTTLEGGLFLDEPLELYRQARDELESGLPPAELLEPAAAWEATLGELGLEVHLALGKWAETARLAAASGNAGYLLSRRSRRLLSRLLSQEKEPIDPALRQPLQAVQATLDRKDLSPEELTALGESLEQIILAQVR